MMTRRVAGLATLAPEEVFRLELLVEGFGLAPPETWTNEGTIYYGEAHRQTPPQQSGKAPCLWDNRDYFPGIGEEGWSCDALINLSRAWTRWPWRIVQERFRAEPWDRAMFVDRAARWEPGTEVMIASDPIWLRGQLAAPLRVAVSDAPEDAWLLAGDDKRKRARWALWTASPGYVLRYLEAELRKAMAS